MGDSPGPGTAQLGGLIKQWMALEEDVRTLSAEIRERRKQLKATRDMITKIMKGAKVGQLNISAGQVLHRTKQTKQPLSKKFIVNTLTEFFNGDAVMAAKCAQFLEDHRPKKVTESLTLDPSTAPPGSPQ